MNRANKNIAPTWKKLLVLAVIATTIKLAGDFGLEHAAAPMAAGNDFYEMAGLIVALWNGIWAILPPPSR